MSTDNEPTPLATARNTWTWIDEEVTITPEALAKVMANFTPHGQDHYAVAWVRDTELKTTPPPPSPPTCN